MGRANEERAFVLCKVEIGKDSSGDDGKGMGIPVEGGHVRSRDQVRGREYVGFYNPGTIFYFIRTYFINLSFNCTLCKGEQHDLNLKLSTY